MVDFIKRDKNDIFNRPVLGFIFKNHKFLTALRVMVTALFFYAVYFGFAYPEKSNIFTGAVFWGVFWALFMVVTLPTFGRIFCGICPHGFLGKYITKAGLQKKMPKWMQNRYIGMFLLVIGWWGIYYTFPGFWKSPLGTASMFGGMTLVAFIIYYIYKDMSYCKFICPIGTLTRAYDKLSFTKLETYTNSCKDCKTFECASACQYNLKPFTFAKKNQTDDCTLCMDCANSCEAVKFKFTKPAEQLGSKLKILNAEIWTYILILASIPVSMGFAHGLERTKIADQFIWNTTANYLGMGEYAGGFAFLYAVLFTVLFSVGGLFLASKVLKKDYNIIFTTLGVAFIPLFIFASLGHTLESFFIKDYAKIVEGFAQGLGMSVDIDPLAKRGDGWLHIFSIFKWIGITWALIILYKRMKLVEAAKLRKTIGYFFASFAILFYIGLNIYTGYVFKTYGAKARGGHNHGGMHSGAMFQSVPFKEATLLQQGKDYNVPTKTNHLV
ncbi:MAG: 4Fe-4S binding protein [Campylobacterota bacterium]|nr:4Fe-4S binding protein [Campylobacterota bacterium]